jgi:CRISPR-associated protein Cas2
VFIVVCYDVVDDKKRAKIAKALEGYGARVQKSVFECRIDEARFMKMKQAVDKIIDWEEDGVRYYHLCAACAKNVDISGWGVVREEEEVIVV